MSETVTIYLCERKQQELDDTDKFILDELDHSDTLDAAPAVMVYNPLTESEVASISMPLSSLVGSKGEDIPHPLRWGKSEGHPIIVRDVYHTFDEFRDFLLKKGVTQSTVTVYEDWFRSRPGYTLGIRLLDNRKPLFLFQARVTVNEGGNA